MENTIYEQDTAKVEYAGFWWRFLANIIDSIIISFVSWIFVIPILGIFGVSLYSLKEAGFDPEQAELLIFPMIGLITTVSLMSTVMQWLYFALMESSKYQGTVGKMVLKIKVTDEAGNRISFARATGRYFGKIISGMILMIGYIMAGFTEKKQALHDMMASCYVIKE
ncbi:MAG: RDD family protein [Bacteroidales bacterium]|nr:RDD family protein [Bacteroidales bacterium]